MKVEDAGYFWYSNFDNTGDQIIIDGDTNKIRTITAIDSTNNILTLYSAVSRTPGRSKVYLYKSFCDPTTVLFAGPAPDIGAFEYPFRPPDTPTGLQVVK
jgi:hypothetical protein